MRVLLSLAIWSSIGSPVMAHKDAVTFNAETHNAAVSPAADDQEKDTKEAALDKIVQQIDAEYAAINAKKMNIRIVKIDEGEFDEGCGTTANVTYSNVAGERPEKIERWLAGDATEELIEFYYKDGKLLFVFRKQVYYPPNTADEAVQSELKIYFDKGKAVKYISNQGDTYQTMDFASEVREGNALFKATTKEQVQEAICPAN